MNDQIANPPAPFILEGTLTELHTEISHENLLRKVLKHYMGQSVVAGVADVVRSFFDQAGNSATPGKISVSCTNEF